MEQGDIIQIDNYYVTRANTRLDAGVTFANRFEYGYTERVAQDKAAGIHGLRLPLIDASAIRNACVASVDGKWQFADEGLPVFCIHAEDAEEWLRLTTKADKLNG